LPAATTTIPKYSSFMWPTLEALRALGNSGTVQEIEAKVQEIGGYSPEQYAVLHHDGPQTEIAYRLAWARTFLKRVNAVENSQRAVWTITAHGLSLTQADMAAIPTGGHAQPGVLRPTGGTAQREAVESDEDSIEFADAEVPWQGKLLEVLVSLDPAQFERLSQRILREQGFVSVTVTGRSGDGGIDGLGVLRIKLLSFPMFFQCKKYKGTVSASAIRDFRGAMVGRSDKGVFITTGRFTPDAMKEATRDGAPPIDLVDGDALCDMLKELKLGVATEMVEQVTIDAEWFRGL
jgi:restriction system protein